MKKALSLLLSMALIGMNLSPVFAQNAYGQDRTEEEENLTTEETTEEEAVLVSTEDDEKPMIQVQQQDRVQDQTNIDESLGADEQEQNRNEIQKVIINRGEDDQLQVQTENQEQEREEYQTENGEQVLFQLELNNEGEDSMLRIRKNADGDTFIEDGDAKVKANFPMEVDAETGMVTITTASGKVVELKEMPSSVLAQILGDKTMDEVEEYELEEDENGDMQYMLKGTDKRKLLGLFEVNVPVEAYVNCENSDEVEIRKPWYLNWFGFLFSNPEV